MLVLNFYLKMDHYLIKKSDKSDEQKILIDKVQKTKCRIEGIIYNIEYYKLC
jgi:hypothetical protein